MGRVCVPLDIVCATLGQGQVHGISLGRAPDFQWCPQTPPPPKSSEPQGFLKLVIPTPGSESLEPTRSSPHPTLPKATAPIDQGLAICSSHFGATVTQPAHAGRKLGGSSWAEAPLQQKVTVALSSLIPAPVGEGCRQGELFLQRQWRR